MWQWWAPELWRRFTIALRRAVAHHLAIPPTDLADVASVQYAKVAEYELRGAVHFHALIRLDDPKNPDGFAPAPAAVTASVLADLVQRAAPAVRFTAPPVHAYDAARVLTSLVAGESHRPDRGAAEAGPRSGQGRPDRSAR